MTTTNPCCGGVGYHFRDCHRAQGRNPNTRWLGERFNARRITPDLLRAEADRLDQTPATGAPSWAIGEAAFLLRLAAGRLEKANWEMTVAEQVVDMFGRGHYLARHGWAKHPFPVDDAPVVRDLAPGEASLLIRAVDWDALADEEEDA